MLSTGTLVKMQAERLADITKLNTLITKVVKICKSQM